MRNFVGKGESLKTWVLDQGENCAFNRSKTEKVSQRIQLFTSGGSRGGARGGAAPPPLFLDQNEARKAEKKIFLRPGPSPYLRVWMTIRPLSEGVDPPLFTFQYCFYVQYLCMIRSWRSNNEGCWSIRLKLSLPIFFMLLLKRNSSSNLSINQYYVFPTSEGTTRQEFNQTSTALSTKQLPRQLWNV